MATWIAHLRIADFLLQRFHGLQETEFIVGNLAPDSGVPNQDWSCYEPPSQVSHFRDEENQVQYKLFADQHFTKEQQKSFHNRQFSFYFGYLTHLMTDILWDEWVVEPCKQNMAKRRRRIKRNLQEK